MAIKLVTPAAILPVTVGQAKISERVDVNDVANDALIEQLLMAATNMAEEFTRRAFITQTWRFETTSLFPIVEIPRPPLQSVDENTVFYFNWNNVPTAIDPDTYFVNNVYGPGQLVFKGGYFPFSITAGYPYWGTYGRGQNLWNFYNGYLSLEFDAGYGDDAEDVPWAIKEGILQIFGSLYQNRESQGIPCGAKQLLDPYRVEYL